MKTPDLPATESPEDFFTFTEVCRDLGKPPIYIRGLQGPLKLNMPGPGKLYSKAYLNFLHKIVALKTFGISMREITDMFDLERNILRLLHADTLTGSSTWYLDSNTQPQYSDNHLLLSGYDLGFPLQGEVIQSNLNFGIAEHELFSGQEMGEDVRRLLDVYGESLSHITQVITSQEPVLLNALHWARQAF